MRPCRCSEAGRRRPGTARRTARGAPGRDEHDELTDFNRVVAVAIAYRDTPDYAAGRERFWAAHADLAPPPLDPKAER